MMGEPWRISLHGGHSGSYCGHARGTLRETLDAAVDAGYCVYGVAEHAPRVDKRFLHPEEREMGWTVTKLAADFERYAQDLAALADEFQDRLSVLRGFEVEVVPDDGYAEIMSGYRDRFAFDYMVGSVHYVGETLIDGPAQLFEAALAAQGGIESLAVRYYEAVGDMVRILKPEVVAHFDLISKNAKDHGPVDGALVRDAAHAALEQVRDTEAILDVNTAGYRKGLGHPYPAPWALIMARDMGIPFCFGDDSHSPEEVGAGIDDARAYLLEHDIDTITTLVRESGGMAKRIVSLQ